MDCPHVKFCVSWFTLRVANVGTAMAIQAWNNPIPGYLQTIYICMHNEIHTDEYCIPYGKNLVPKHV